MSHSHSFSDQNNYIKQIKLMKISIYESKFLSSFYHENKNAIEFEWKSTTKQMSDSMYLKEAEKQAELIEKHKVKLILANGIQFKYIIAPKIQKQIDYQVTPRYLQCGVKKLAAILPTDTFEKVSIQQLFDEKNVQQIAIKYFDNIQKAWDWLSMPDA